VALLSSFAYTRTRVRQGKTGQRVRLAAVVDAASVGAVFNLTHRVGNYGRTSQRAGTPYFAWSNYPNGPPFEHDTAVSSPACTDARFAWDSRRSILLTCLDDTTVLVRRSDDDALSFNTETSLFTGASWPDITASREGLILYAARVSGALSIRRQYPGDAAPAAAFDAEDDTATPLALTDDSFRLVYDSRGWLLLHARLGAGASTSLLQSYDDGETFESVSGAVTGISGGSHPGACVGADGTAYAYARLSGGEISLTRRAPGDTAWTTPAVVVDEASADLLIEDFSFSMAEGFEGSRRLVLVAIFDGESLPQERYSADDGESFAAFPGT
jgi:hypothetical protein